MTDAAVTESIGRQAGRGLRFSLAGTLLTKLGSFAMGLVLARLLAPSDFGVYAIALAATAVLMHINDVGLIAATVQWRGRLEDMAPTAATMAMAFAVGIYVVFWVAAPTFATASGNSAAAPVVRLLTLIIVIDGITAVRSGALMRHFEQGRLVLANSAGLVVNAVVAITLAATGAGAFSFAWGQVTGAAMTGLLVFLFGRVPFRYGFDRAIARKLLVFGVPLAASLGVEAVVTNVQFAVVGHITGAVALGYFLLAFNVASWAQSILGQVSRLSEHDDEALSAGVQRSVPLMVTVVAPIVALTSVLAVPMVALLYGERWLPAAPVLRILVGLTLARMLTGLAMDALMGAGATRATLWLNLGWAVVLVPTLWFASEAGGIRGAAYAQTGVAILVAVPLAAYALHRARVALAPVGLALVRPLGAAVLAAAVAVVVVRFAGTNAFVQLAVAGTAGVLVYVPIAVPREQLRQLWTALRHRQPAGAALAE
ncbi:MAG: lipopolysaccharide biosynthesis protein [Actinobacteria bacterium]|nr:MAG: lipopolysaccharide biosynthesis protein [Actinomycetota bacterium]